MGRRPSTRLTIASWPQYKYSGNMCRCDLVAFSLSPHRPPDWGTSLVESLVDTVRLSSVEENDEDVYGVVLLLRICNYLVTEHKNIKICLPLNESRHNRLLCNFSAIIFSKDLILTSQKLVWWQHQLTSHPAARLWLCNRKPANKGIVCQTQSRKSDQILNTAGDCFGFVDDVQEFYDLTKTWYRL